MNNNYHPRHVRINSTKQTGMAVLVMTLVILAVLTVIGVTSSKTAVIETRMTINSIEKNKSRIASESALNYALGELYEYSLIDFLEVCDRNGLFDLRTTASDTCPDPGNPGQTVPANNQSAWDGIASASNWGWNSTSLHNTILDKLSADNSPILTDDTERLNPMKLISTPQFAIGIHDAILRPGSENQHCFPVSIISAARGGITQSQTLIEIKLIPPNGCFYP